MSLYSDRILSMSAAYRLNLAVVGLLAATSIGVAGPTALVESVVTQSASANVMSYVETGKTFRLGTEDTMTLNYPDACLRETITGGTVTIGIDRSEVQGGQVARIKLDCGSRLFELTGSTGAAAQPETAPSGGDIPGGSGL